MEKEEEEASRENCERIPLEFNQKLIEKEEEASREDSDGFLIRI